MSNMIDIKAPNLLNANFGANVKQQFDNIYELFNNLRKCNTKLKFFNFCIYSTEVILLISISNS